MFVFEEKSNKLAIFYSLVVSVVFLISFLKKD